ncbi:hypothetical protein [Micromonospora sp. 4G55]|uniref:hypothetical protein n=1 Tax=Micromonospora sp. 4G55 TaxID=2806102 RepID=UPI001EE4E6CA|nr:hypothetical protein [Micromonospora sp. 4G55]
MSSSIATAAQVSVRRTSRSAGLSGSWSTVQSGRFSEVSVRSSTAKHRVTQKAICTAVWRAAVTLAPIAGPGSPSTVALSTPTTTPTVAGTTASSPFRNRCQTR